MELETMCWKKEQRSRLRRKETKDWWEAHTPKGYEALRIGPRIGRGKELDLKRPTLARLVEARTGHGDFKKHGERRGWPVFDPHCGCGADKEPLHFYHCPAYAEAWKKRKKKGLEFPSRDRMKQTKWMISTERGAKVFALYAQETRYFEEMVPYGGRRQAGGGQEAGRDLD